MPRFRRFNVVGVFGFAIQTGVLFALTHGAQGVLLRPLGDIIYFMPPYVITDAETRWALDQIREVLARELRR